MIFHLTLRSISTEPPRDTVLSVRCPACGQRGTFEALEGLNDLSDSNQVCTFGQRFCPNDRCRAHVFFVMQQRNLVALYPPVRLTFDSSALPDAVKSSLEEAISCLAAGCYRAAAIMVRRTLEALCEDHAVEGPNLKSKITALGNLVVLPNALVEGIDHLRLLGNDAAHLESKAFDTIGQAELEVAIRFTKVVLRAVYQYAGLVDELKSLQKSALPASTTAPDK
jgi:hypothetical protein